MSGRDEINQIFNHACDFVRQDDIEAALERFRHITSTAPEFAAAWYGIGHAMYHIGQYREAIPNLQEAIRLNANHKTAHLVLSKCLMITERYDLARATFEQILLRWPDLPEGHYGLAYLAQTEGNFQAAINAYRETIRLQPDYAHAHSGLGYCYNMNKEPYQAISAYREAIRLNPKCAEYQYNLGSTFLNAGKSDEARIAWIKVIELDVENGKFAKFAQDALDYHSLCSLPDYRRKSIGETMSNREEVNNSYDQACTLCKQGDIASACDGFLRVVSLDPHYDAAFYGLGYCLSVQGRYPEAIPNLQEAIRLNANHKTAHLVLSKCLMITERYDLARATFEQILLRWPDLPEGHYGLAYLAQTEGNFQAAINAYRETIRLQPDYAHAHSGLGYCYNMNKEPYQAISAYREAIRLNPQRAEYQHALGHSLYAIGRLDEARLVWIKVIELDEENGKFAKEAQEILCRYFSGYDR